MSGLLLACIGFNSSVSAQPTPSLSDEWSIEEYGASQLAGDSEARLLPLSESTTEQVVISDRAVEPAGWLRHHCGVLGPDPCAGDFPTLKVSGFFQADGIWFAQDDVNKVIVGDAQDVADFRRARLAAGGQVAPNVAYFMEYDFAFSGRPSFMDVYVDFADISRFGHLRIGQWRQPFGMDAQTSVKELLFLERALPFAFVPFR